jgi:HK97 family phage major capsid protein
MATLRELKGKLDAKREEMAAIFRAYPNVAEMPAEEAKKIKPLNDEISDLGKQYEDAKKEQDDIDEIRRAGNFDRDDEQERGSKGSRRDLVPNGDGRQEREPQGERSLAEIIRGHKGYQAFVRGGMRGAVEIDFTEAELKTLMTLTTINNQATRRAGIIPSAQYRIMVEDLMLGGSTDNNTLTYMEETTFTNAAAETAEGSAKPEAALAFTERTDNARKTAVWVPATTELLADVSGIESYIRGRLVFMLSQRFESQLLVGDGTAPNHSGILDRSGIQTQALGGDPVPDAFYKAMTKVRVTGAAEPTAHVIHPNDWEPIRLMATADGVYIWGHPSEEGPERLWGLPVRITTGITEGTGLTGAFTPFAQVFNREGVRVILSTEHASYFVENKVAILAERRDVFAVYRPAAFCSVTGI